MTGIPVLGSALPGAGGAAATSEWTERRDRAMAIGAGIGGAVGLGLGIFAATRHGWSDSSNGIINLLSNAIAGTFIVGGPLAIGAGVGGAIGYGVARATDPTGPAPKPETRERTFHQRGALAGAATGGALVLATAPMMIRDVVKGVPGGPVATLGGAIAYLGVMTVFSAGLFAGAGYGVGHLAEKLSD